MATQRVIKFDSLANSVSAAELATTNANTAKTQADTARDEALAAATEALASSDINPNYISYEVGVLPTTVGVPTGTIGAYYTTDGNFQKLIFENGSWAEIGETLPSISYVNRKLSDEEDNRTNAISGAINQEVIDRDGAIGSAINQEVIDRNLKITQEVQSEAIARSQEISDEKIYLEGKIDTNTNNIITASKGINSFKTKTLMDLFTPVGGDSEIAKVWGDSTASNNGTYNWDSDTTAWIKDSALTEVSTIKGWVTAESFDVSNMTFSSNGNIATADLVWIDGEVGTISNLVEDGQGRITSLRYNRPSAKYITQTITYDVDGNVTTTALTATGY